MKIDDLLGECVKVFLFSFGRNRGERKKYKGELCCSGEELDQRHPWKKRKGQVENEMGLNPLPVSGRGQGEGHGKVGE